MFNRCIIRRFVITICLFSLSTVAVSNVLALSPFDKVTDRRLNCPPVEGTIKDPIPGGFNHGEIIKREFDTHRATCGYFKKKGDTTWESVVYVTVYWVEKDGVIQFDCKWVSENDPDKYIVSKSKQAYAEFSIGTEDIQTARKVAEDLLAQAEEFALACPEQ